MIGDLEREGLIRKIPVDKKRVADLLALSRRDLSTSRTLLASSHDWAYTVAYNAVLQAGRALMASRGYRPDGQNQHISVVKFAALFLDEKSVLVFDRMRRKRNTSVYDAAGTVSATEAEFAVTQAEHLTGIIAALLETA
jgi:uncharacterized protein (UPF0332 family)